MARRRSTPRQALLVGDPNLIWPIPQVVAAAGFEVDVVTVAGTRVHRSRRVRRTTVAGTLAEGLALAGQQSEVRTYDWIIIGDDASLRLVRTDPRLTPETRLRLAPVTDATHLSHLASKVVLTQRLAELPVSSPRFRLAKSAPEAAAAAEELGGTALLKPDFGSGGAGIIFAEHPTEAAVGWHLIASRETPDGPGLPGGEPGVLLQEYVNGCSVDVSGIFWNGALIHYTYARSMASHNRFGATSVRHYYPTSDVSPAIVEELGVIGTGLGLHGFANISCIESLEGDVRHYFEVDVRPNLWAAFGAEFGDDPVRRLQAWFDEGRVTLPASSPESRSVSAATSDSGTDRASPTPRDRQVAIFKRLSRKELLLNRHRVWRDVPWSSPEGRRLFLRALLR